MPQLPLRPPVKRPIFAAFLCVATFLANSLGFAQEAQQGVVVLHDGRVYSGIVGSVPGGYRIDSNGHQIIVPFEHVHVMADSLLKAYEAMRGGIGKPTAEDHLALAEWCLKQNQISSAKIEVANALRLEPYRPEARALLKRIDESLAPSSEPAAAKQSIALSTFYRTDDLTSAGLSREQHLEYARRIQPLLLNKCGNAHCHGQAADNEFRLANAQFGSRLYRTGSVQNLKLILDRIDPERPEQSPILMKAIEPSESHKSLFLGDAQHRQYQILKNWVLLAAAEKQAQSPRDRTGTKMASSRSGTPQAVQTIQQTSAEVRVQTPATEEPKVLEHFRKQSLPDAFDPDAFNQKVHGVSISGG